MEAYIAHLLIIIGIFGILTMGQNIILGYTGLFGIAQAGFYGIGAYTSALMVLKLGLPFWPALIAAPVWWPGLIGWLPGPVHHAPGRRLFLHRHPWVSWSS